MKPTLNDLLDAAERGEPIHILHHHPCPDGFGAAWCAWSRLGGRAKFIPYDHEDPPGPQACAGAWAVMCDCCFRRAGVEEAASLARGLLTLDHHQSAMEDCEGLEPCVFDMERSGCAMAWDFFYPGRARPALIEHVQDRDLGRMALEGTGAFCSKLDSLPATFEAWDEAAKLAGPALARFMREGAEMLNQFEAQAQAIAAGAARCMFMGQRALLLNAPYRFASRCGAILCAREGARMALIWSSKDLIRARLSLRSLPGSGVDVSELAGRLGGGGHPTSSGAGVGLAELMEMAAAGPWEGWAEEPAPALD